MRGIVAGKRFFAIIFLWNLTFSAFCYDRNDKFIINGTGETITITYKACAYVENDQFCVDGKNIQLSKGQKFLLSRDNSQILKKIEGPAGKFEYKLNSISLNKTVVERYGNKYFAHNAGW